MTAYNDLEGKIPATPGDRVALIKGEEQDWVQEDPEKRPYIDDAILFFDGRSYLEMREK